ncbi:MAG: hypothetical protein ACRDJW_10595 [Thermomicrobiales bacterium]
MGHLCERLRYLGTLACAVALAGAVTLHLPLGAVSAPLVQEQDEDEQDDDAGAVVRQYAAGIYAGSCDSLGADPVFPLTTVAPHGESDDGVFASETEGAAPIADLLGDPHAITILASGDDLATIRACAEIDGQALNGKLITGLRTPDDDALLGVAVLEEREGATVVDLYLILSDGEIAVDDGSDDGNDGDDGDDGGV